MYIKTLLFLFVLHLPPAPTSAQLVKVRFAQPDSLQKIESRKVIVLLGAEWCNWCEAMKQTTFKEREVVQTMNRRYYFIDFNIEEKSTILFNGRRYAFKATGSHTGMNELAQALGGGTVPAICVLDEANEIIFQYSGFLPAKDLLELLHAMQDVNPAGR
ncbi:MAG TPA: thioredoxin family protein [Flavisolibacter sp.]|nr:thioredoxin family protein [Flavisolibacter sp.]